MSSRREFKRIKAEAARRIRRMGVPMFECVNEEARTAKRMAELLQMGFTEDMDGRWEGVESALRQFARATLHLEDRIFEANGRDPESMVFITGNRQLLARAPELRARYRFKCVPADLVAPTWGALEHLNRTLPGHVVISKKGGGF